MKKEQAIREFFNSFHGSSPIQPKAEVIRTSNGITIFPLRNEPLSPSTIEKVFAKETIPNLEQPRSHFARLFSATLQNYECKYFLLNSTTCFIISIPIIIILVLFVSVWLDELRLL